MAQTPLAHPLSPGLPTLSARNLFPVAGEKVACQRRKELRCPSGPISRCTDAADHIHHTEAHRRAPISQLQTGRFQPTATLAPEELAVAAAGLVMYKKVVILPFGHRYYEIVD